MIFWKPVALVLGATFIASSARAEDPKIAGPTTFVRFAHYVVKGDKVDIFVDDKKKFNDVGFDFLSKYLRFPAGTHRVKITSNNPTRTILSTRQFFASGKFATVAAYGRPRYPRLLVGRDSAGRVLYGRARLTINHLSPGTRPFNVVAYTQTGRTIRLATNVRYGQSRTIQAPTGQMTIKLTSGGTTIKTITGASPRMGRRYGLYATGATRTNFKVVLAPIASQ